MELNAVGDLVVAEGQAAARELARVMLLNEAERPRRWVETDEPRLRLEWARAAGMFNARVWLTVDELRVVQEELERVLAPFTSREPQDAPDETAPVRVLAYFMPESPDATTQHVRTPEVTRMDQLEPARQELPPFDVEPRQDGREV